MKKQYLILAILSTSLWGVTLPNLDAIGKNIEVPKELQEIQEAKKGDLVEVQGVERYAPMMVDDKSGRKILVENFKITHAKNIKKEILEEIVAPYKGKELTFGEVENIASLITKGYRKEGFFVARAYIPLQKIENNTIEISVIEGYYGEFKIKNNSLVNDKTVQGIFDDLKKKDINQTTPKQGEVK